MTLSDLLNEFNVVIDTAEGLTELRSLILGLAVRGKLVPQDPNDEPASELLKKIEAEKERLYDEGEIRKPRSLPNVDEDNVYEIPQIWEWVNLIDIGLWATGTGFPKKYQGEENQEVLFCKVSDMNLPGNELFIEATINTVSWEVASKLSANVHSKGTIIFPKIGGAIATNKRRLIKKPTIIDNNCLGITPYLEHNIDWLFLLLKNIDLTDYQSGSSVPALAQGNLEVIPVPLPPLAEQHRIVAKIESLFAEVDELEEKLNHQTKLDEKLKLAVNAEVQQAPDAEASQSAWNFITNNFETLYHTPESIDNLKKNILNEAVRGRLVPQNPNDEPASELLKNIEAEKERLYKAGEIRKPKNLPQVNEDEIPFEIPESWEWVRFQDITSVITCGIASTPKYVDSGKIFLSAKNVKPFKFKPDDHKFVSKETYQKITQNAKPELNDILITRVGAGIGETAIIDQEIDFAYYVSLTLVKPIKILNPYYLLYWLNSPEGISNAISYTSGRGSSQGNLNVGRVREFCISIPPLEEQHRIVRRIEELFALCDRFKAQLEQRQAVNEKLVKGLVNEVLEGS